MCTCLYSNDYFILYAILANYIWYNVYIAVRDWLGNNGL